MTKKSPFSRGNLSGRRSGFYNPLSWLWQSGFLCKWSFSDYLFSFVSWFIHALSELCFILNTLELKNTHTFTYTHINIYIKTHIYTNLHVGPVHADGCLTSNLFLCVFRDNRCCAVGFKLSLDDSVSISGRIRENTAQLTLLIHCSTLTHDDTCKSLQVIRRMWINTPALLHCLLVYACVQVCAF